MRNLAKRLALALAMVVVGPVAVFAKLWLLAGRDGTFRSAAAFLSLFPGMIGSYLRSAFYLVTLQSISCDVHIDFGSFFSRSTAVVGRNVCIGAYCILGNVRIGDDVLIASRVSVPSGKYQHGDRGLGSAQESQLQYSVVTIGNRAWIGEGAVVLADVGEECIVAAGSVVTRPMPPRYVIAGNPARPTLRRDAAATKGEA